MPSRASGTRPLALILRLATPWLLVATSGASCASSAAPKAAPPAPPAAGTATAVEAMAPAGAENRFVDILLREGDRPLADDGLLVETLGIASADSLGRVGFGGILAGTSGREIFVWKDDGVLWRSSQVADPPGSISPLVGVGNAGQFVFRAPFRKGDVVWSHHGAVLAAPHPAPGIPGGVILSSNWTTMTGDGTAYWISEFRDGPGSKGRGRVLYRATDAAPDAVEVVLRSDDLVDGLPIARPYGLDLSYQVSDDGSHLAQVLYRETGGAQDEAALYVDGALALIEGQPTGAGDAWHRFQRVSINDRGDYLVTGETDAANGKDAVVAHNGRIVAREGMTLAGRQLAAQAATLSVSIDNQGRAVHLWSVGGFGAEYLFFACDAARLADSVLLLETGSPLRLADPEAQMVVSELSDVGHGPALWLGPGDRLFVEAELHDKRQPPEAYFTEAIISLPLPSCPLAADSEAPANAVEAAPAGQALATPRDASPAL